MRLKSLNAAQKSGDFILWYDAPEPDSQYKGVCL